MFDVINNVENTRIACLDKGFVSLIDVMPRLVPDDQKTADGAIVQSARVSYGEGTKTVSQDKGLIRYLMRHAHTTPFEMVEFKFHCKMPIFIARQWIRHRTANVNEVSGRYSVLKDEFYLPDANNVRVQSDTNKQGGSKVAPQMTAQYFSEYLGDLCNSAYCEYEALITKGISREQARMALPVNLYTEWYWKIDLHNLFHFLSLRCDSHAQQEIRVFGEAMLELIEPIVPIAVEAWNDYHPMRGAVKFTRLELESLTHYFEVLGGDLAGIRDLALPKIDTDNKREQQEWKEKVELLGVKLEE